MLSLTFQYTKYKTILFFFFFNVGLTVLGFTKKKHFNYGFFEIKFLVIQNLCWRTTFNSFDNTTGFNFGLKYGF
jgi:hypothetical protein